MIVIAIIVLLIVVEIGRLLFKLATTPRPAHSASLTLYERPWRRRTRRAPTLAERPRRYHSPLTYQEQLAEAADRYEAELIEENERLDSLPQEPVPIVALHETQTGMIGVGADGELVEIDSAENLTDVSP